MYQSGEVFYISSLSAVSELVRIKMCLSETYSEVWRGRHLSVHFLLRKSATRDALSRVLYNFVLDLAVRKIRAKQEILKLNGNHQLLVLADDVNLSGLCLTVVKDRVSCLISTEYSREIW
jgi:hypothetical protein